VDLDLSRIQKWDDQSWGFVFWSIDGIVNAYRNTGRSGPITFIDVGANVGKATDIISDILDIKESYMFEPVPNLYNYLKTKYSNSKKHYIFNCALTDKDTPFIDFDHSSFDNYLSTDYKDEYLNLGVSKIMDSSNKISIKNYKLSTFFKEHNHLYNENLIIKIDTENQDAYILKDFLTVLTSFKSAPLIEFEINHTNLGLPNSFVQDIIDEYFKTGLYYPFSIDKSLKDGKSDELLIPTK